ncbi:MAG: hypothetical protein U0793_29765 [Gemmataceae bacterium]
MSVLRLRLVSLGLGLVTLLPAAAPAQCKSSRSAGSTGGVAGMSRVLPGGSAFSGKVTAFGLSGGGVVPGTSGALTAQQLLLQQQLLTQQQMLQQQILVQTYAQQQALQQQALQAQIDALTAWAGEQPDAVLQTAQLGGAPLVRQAATRELARRARQAGAQ